MPPPSSRSSPSCPPFAAKHRAEWWDERTGAAQTSADEGHRHFSHLYPLHPGDAIDPITRPALAAAARKSLVRRLKHGGGHTGWSSAWAASLWARLHEGALAHAALRYTLHEFAAPNLLGLHPKLRGSRQGCMTCVGRGPGGAGEGMYQLDANGGYTAAVAEMLLQSHSQVCRIHLLPALPPAWQEGDARGLRARGAWRVDVGWSGGRLVSAAIARSPAESGSGDRLAGVSTAVRVCCAPNVCGADGSALAAAARVDYSAGQLLKVGPADHGVWAWNATVTDEHGWSMRL